MSDALLIAYLCAIKNNGRAVKFKRSDPFASRFRDDVLAAFDFFRRFADIFDQSIKPKWRVVDYTVQLLGAEKALLPGVYRDFKTERWDLQLSWVEGVVRTRDDWDRGTISAIKSAAATVYVERGVETIMGKVK